MMNELEKKTREERIDKKLESCGWQIVNFDSKIQLSSYTCHAVREFPTDSGPVDYALFYEGKIIGVIEAKRLSLGPQNVLIQAQRYAQGISQSNFNFDGFRVPFIYSTNGEIFWFQDLRERNSYSRRIANFHRPEALNEMLKKDYNVDKLRWLELIKNHLIENLTIDKGDFNKIPAFTRIGGWNVANRIFGNQLESLLHTINTEMATA